LKLRVKHIFIYTILSLTAQAQQYQFDTYTAGENGLAQSEIYSIIEDSRGYVWMGTQGGGIDRFDGRSFENFRSREGLSSSFVHALYESADKRIWLGTQNGLSSYNGHTFQSYRPERLQNFWVTSILEKDSSQLLVGTHKGLYQLEEDKLIRITDIPQRHVHHLFKAKDKSIWVSTSRGLFRVMDGKPIVYGADQEIHHKEFRCVSQAKDGAIWAATFTGGIYIIEKDTTRRLTVVDGIEGQHVQVLYKDRAGKMWIGTQDRGINIYDPSDKTFTHLSQVNGLVRNDVRSITEDDWGNIWIGTVGGVNKYYGRQFEHISINNSANDDYVYAITEDTLGHLWVSASGKGIAQIKDGEIVRFNRNFGFMDVRCKAIFVDDANRVWIGTEGKGLSLYDGKGFNSFNEIDGLGGSFVKDILQDKDKNIWVATAGAGIHKITVRDTLVFQEKKIKNDTLALILSDTIYRDSLVVNNYSFKRFEGQLLKAYIQALFEDSAGRIWFATRNMGLGVMENDSIIQIYDRSKGLPDNDIRSVVEDKDGYLWLATANAGICRLHLEGDSMEVKLISEKDGINSNNVYLLTLDEVGNVWAGCGKGVDFITLDASRNKLKIKHYGKSEGFVGVETCKNSVLRDRSGRLWFGTVNGLTMHLPGATRKNLIPSKVYINEVRIGYDPLQKSAYADYASDWGGIKENLVVPYTDNQWSFEFKGINQAKPDQTLFKWKMEGWDKDWIGPFKRTGVDYSNLSPGNYTFSVMAGNREGVFDGPVDSVQFAIEPPIWQTWWFKLAAALLGMLLIGLFIRLRINRIRRESAIKTERLEMEKSMLQLEQKALQLQMNPHFIFNVLNSIQSLITKKDEKTARYFLAKFSKLMRAILENSRETKITLEQEIETLQNYLGVEQFSRGNSFDFEIKVDPKLDVDEVMIPPMLLQPFVENAIIHGVGQVVEGGKVVLEFIQKYGTLECIITDNGPGIEKARARKSQQAHTHKSAALEVTQERLDILNAGIKNRSLEITDLSKEGAGLTGTKVVLRLIMNEISR